MTEKGTLPVGIKYNGEIHTKFEIREQLVCDGINIYDNPELASRAEKNNAFMGLCILTSQIVSLGTIPKENITVELLLNMPQSNLNELNSASKRLEERRKNFRGEE